jgi:hypothetical protein
VLLDFGMTHINSFRDLLVWQKAMDLAVRCYGVSRRMPRDEQGVLGYQIRKCAVSMPSNIAEGKVSDVRFQVSGGVQVSGIIPSQELLELPLRRRDSTC